MSEWLRFEKSGEYAVEAIYTVEILNAEKGASPISWKVKLRKQFKIRVSTIDFVKQAFGMK